MSLNEKFDNRALRQGENVEQFLRAEDWNAVIKHVRGYINVQEPPYNAVGDGVTDDTAAIQAAITAAALGQTVVFPAGTYLVSAKLTTNANTHLRGGGRGVTLKKGANGYMLNLSYWTSIEGIRFDGQRGTYTGGGIEIDVGDNDSTIEFQGHQRIDRCWFQDFQGYAIDYTTDGKGWMSRVTRSTFWSTDQPAHIRWPDDAVSGGNRYVVDCYSDSLLATTGGALVNANGADNGIIAHNTIGSGGYAYTGQGVYFPAGTTNRAKKIQIIGNRIAVAGTMNVRGTDLVFAENIIAGSVTLESNAAADGTTASVWRPDNIVVGTFTDSSGTANEVSITERQDFTPTWSSTSNPQPSFGDADVRCEWTREGAYVHAKYFIKFGSTTTFGTSTWRFTTPVARYTTTSTDFAGVALLKDRAGVVRTLHQSGVDLLQLHDGSGNAVTSAAPVAWAANDLLVIDITYRIF